MCRNTNYTPRSEKSRTTNAAGLEDSKNLAIGVPDILEKEISSVHLTLGSLSVTCICMPRHEFYISVQATMCLTKEQTSKGHQPTNNYAQHGSKARHLYLAIAIRA